MPKLQFPNEHPNGWFDDDITKDGLKRVWGRRPGVGKDHSVLVLDAFRSHRSPVVKSVLNAEKTDLAIIPGGMTSVLQPLDVSVNKPMKMALRQRLNDRICGSDLLIPTRGG